MGLPWQINLPAGKSTSIFLNAKFWSLLTLWVVWFQGKQGSHRHGIRDLSLCTWAGVWVWEKRRCRGSILPPCTQIIFLSSLDCFVCLWLNALGQCASPPFRQGWETWKLANVFLGLKQGGGSHLCRSEPYSPEGGLHKTHRKPLCATPWLHKGQRGSHTTRAALAEQQLHRGPEAQWFPKRPALQSIPYGELGLFPMHTYLERTVKLKWALLYMLVLMVTVIKDNSIYSMSQVEPWSKSPWDSPQLFFIEG